MIFLPYINTMQLKHPPIAGYIRILGHKTRSIPAKQHSYHNQSDKAKVQSAKQASKYMGAAATGNGETPLPLTECHYYTSYSSVEYSSHFKCPDTHSEKY